MRITALWLTVCAALAFAAPAFGEEQKTDAKAEKVANKTPAETPAVEAMPPAQTQDEQQAAAKDAKSKPSQ